MITLISMTTFLLSKQMTKLEEKFVTEGGYREKMFKKRVEYRQHNYPKYPNLPNNQ